MLLKNIKQLMLFAGLAISIAAVQSCNKEFEDIESVAPPTVGPTAGELIETEPSFSILEAAVTKAGLLDLLKTKGAAYTVFAPDDAAFALSGISLATINALPAADLKNILSYHVIPQSLPTAQITSNFPNVQMPSLLALPSPSPLTKMSIFPSKRSTGAFANNIPIKQPDVTVSNGVLHKVAAVVAPPTQLVAQITGADADLSFFRAAVARADSGQVGLNRLDSVMKFGLANITVFAPTNDAVKQVLVALGLPPVEAAFNFVPVQTARGLVAYHMLGSRAFSINLPLTTSPIQTLLGPSPFPPVIVDRSTALPRLTGAGNGGRFANFVATEKNAVNGVVHKIDMVLLPQ